MEKGLIASTAAELTCTNESRLGVYTGFRCDISHDFAELPSGRVAAKHRLCRW